MAATKAISINESSLLLVYFAETHLKGVYLYMSFEDQFGEYHVEVSRMHSPEHGDCVKEVWTKDGVFHRTSEPAITIMVAETRKIVEEQYYLNGLHHRKDGPSRTEWLSNGVIRRESWQVNGSHHREEGPAFVMRDAVTGKITSEHWCLDGEAHRLDGAAVIEIDGKTGIIIEEDWMQHGEYFRDDGGPVCITRDAETGGITCELRRENMEPNGAFHNSGSGSGPSP
ncbi:MAG: hypothetical protein ACSHXK_16855 [Oceanococcus sp.]